MCLCYVHCVLLLVVCVCVCVCECSVCAVRACVQCVHVCRMARAQALCLPSLEPTKPVYICKCFKSLTRITQSYLWPEYVCCVQEDTKRGEDLKRLFYRRHVLVPPPATSDHMGTFVLSSVSTRLRHVPSCFFRPMDILLGKVNSHTLLHTRICRLSMRVHKHASKQAYTRVRVRTGSACTRAPAHARTHTHTRTHTHIHTHTHTHLSLIHI